MIVLTILSFKNSSLVRPTVRECSSTNMLQGAEMARISCNCSLHVQTAGLVSLSRSIRQSGGLHDDTGGFKNKCM